MTPAEALALMDQAASLAALTRAQHIQVAQAKAVLEKLIPTPLADKDQTHA
jgi:hypothetical protein